MELADPSLPEKKMAEERSAGCSIPRSSVERTTECDWSAIPRDVLDMISRLLTSPLDYFRFRSVCSAWRSAAPMLRHLLVAVARKRGKDIYSFFSLCTDGREGPLQLPEFSLDKHCFSFSCGWMALFDHHQGHRITLFNPVTRSHVQLPPINADGREIPAKVVLSSDQVAGGSDCVVMVITNVSWWCKAAFWRPGDDAWIVPAENPFFRPIDDAVFCNGRFYVLHRPIIYVCNVDGDTAVVEKLPTGGPWLDEKIMSVDQRVKDLYLVESAGDVLVVIFRFNLNGLRDVKVYKLQHGEQSNFLRMKRLGDRALFLSRSQSFSLSAAQFLRCKGNQIYLIRDPPLARRDSADPRRELPGWLALRLD